MPVPGPIVVICTANICRSPMGEGLLTHALAAEPAPVSHLKVLSAGVVARPGDPVSANSVMALKKVGIDISGHRAQTVTQEMLDAALAVFVMTEGHRAMIELQATPPPARLYLFREFLPDPAAREIGDPFGSSLRFYEQSRDEMVEAIPSILAYLRQLLTQK